jgi:hypothetical protein
MRFFKGLSNLMGSIVSTLRGQAPNAKSEKPNQAPSLVERLFGSDKPLTGRRAPKNWTILRVEDIGPLLSEKNPFFKARSGGKYAVATHPVLTDDGKMIDAPAYFIRVDKDRTPRKLRKLRKKIRRASAAYKQALPEQVTA